MIRIKFLFILFIFFISHSGFAQKIDYKNIDHHYLEHLIKKRIDSLRKEKELPALYNDSILYLAAKDHADYLLRTNNVGHYQPKNKTKETPHKRITYYGGDYLTTAENVASSYLFLPVTNKKEKENPVTINDYKSAASNFAENWKNSPGHYKNIINDEFNITGVAISYNKQSQAIYAVQTFAKTNRKSKYEYVIDTLYKNDSPEIKQYEIPKPHRRHAWKIKPADKNTDTRPWERFKKRYLNRNFRLLIQNDSMYLHINSKNSIRSLLRHKKDGLAIEIISFMDYIDDSIYYSKPSRRNNACIFNGIVPEPIYKEELNKLFKEQRKSKKLVINFGKIPDHLSSVPLEFNVLILKKNRLIDIVKFNHLKGTILNYPVHLDTIPYKFIPRDVGYDKKPEFDTLIHKIYFERDATEIDSLNESLLKSKFNFEEYKPYFGIVTAYASVEGFEDHNKKLYKTRSKNLIKIVQNEYQDSFPLFVHTKENWDLFEKQIKNTEYSFLNEESTEFVKKFLRLEKPLEDLDTRLDKQRYVNFYLISEEILTEKKVIDHALNNYKKTFKRINDRIAKSKYYSVSNTEQQKLSDLQHFIFNKILEDKISMHTLNQLPVKFNVKYLKENQNRFNQLEIDRLKFQLTYNANNLNRKYTLLSKLAKLEIEPPIPVINFFILSIDERFNKELYWHERINKDFVKGLKSVLNSISNPDTIPFYDNLNLFYHISRLTVTYLDDPYSDYSIVNNSLDYVFNYFSDTTLSEDVRFKAAKFMVLFYKYEYAWNILRDIYSNGTKNKEIIKYYLILHYTIYDKSLSEYFRFLFESSEIFSKEEWCKLFYDDYHRLNFSILDNEIIRDYFCTQCGCVE